MANRTRNIVLRLPVTAEERALIEKKMQQMGTRCFSVYARKMLIDQKCQTPSGKLSWSHYSLTRYFFLQNVTPFAALQVPL